MARRIVNRKEQRLTDEQMARQSTVADEAVAAEPKAKKAARPRKSRAKVAKEVRLKAFWGVYSQTMALVAQFEYSQRAEAEKKAQEMTESKKTPHFVQVVKKVIEE